MTAHAYLSASGSYRWLNCTKAPILEEGFPDTTSIFAEEGTLAHEISELILWLDLNKEDTDPEVKEHAERFKAELAQLKKHELFYEGMINEVEIYTTYCLERFNEFKANDKHSILDIEQRLDYSRYAPEGFGTGDCVIVGDNKIEVIDLKFGKGVEVDPKNNSQLMLYGLGALEAYDFLYDIKEITLTVAQVRLGGISSWTLSTKKLEAWGEIEVKEKAQLAFNGKGEARAGEWCMFCKFKGQCKVRGKYLKDIYDKHKEKERETLSLEEVSEIISNEKLIKNWLKDVEQYALGLGLAGTKIPGFKVVEGRSNRRITDGEGLASVLIEKGYEDEDVYKPKAIEGITKLEKLVGKKDFADLSKDYIEKPEGRPTLAKDSDRRKSIVQSVEDEFDFS